MVENGCFNLTNPQKSIWNMGNFFEGTCVCNVCTVGLIREKTDIKLLVQAINNVVKKNDNFRLVFGIKNGVPVQLVKDYELFDIPVIQISDESELYRLEREAVSQKFEKYGKCLFDFKIAALPNDHVAIILTVDHIIADSWALGLVIQAILREYFALKKGEVLSEPLYSYIDYIKSENDYKHSKKYEADKAYWADVFDTIPEQATIPSTKNVSKNVSCAAARVSYTLNPGTGAFIKTFCQREKISVFNYLMSIFSIYLSKVSNQTDFTIGTPILNRSNFKEKQTMGMYVNTVPVRITIPENTTFIEFAKSINMQMLGVLKHQKYSYTQILEDIRRKEPTTSSLYNILISYQITKAYNKDLGNYETAWIFNNNAENDINIHITDINDTGNLEISYDYQIAKYTEQDIKNMHTRILHLISQISRITEPNTSITDINLKDIEIATHEEKNDLIYKFNNTAMAYQKNKTIAKLIEEQSERTPDKIALVFENQTLTYKQLNEKSNSLAYYLRTTYKVCRDDIVGIMVNRSLEMIIAILAVLKAGAAYTPIDPTYPKDRIDYMLKSSNTKVLLTNAKTLKTNNIDFKNKLTIDLENDAIYNKPFENLEIINKPDDLSYVIFTSGSTGMPKGVMLTHKALMNLTNYCNNYVEYLKNPIYQAVVSTTTISFDIFIFETLISLQKGLKLVIANEEEQNTPGQLNRLIARQNIKIMQATPSRMQLFLNNKDKMPALRNLEYITLAGEQLPLSIVKELDELYKIKVYNGYGPSETTVFSTLTKMDTKRVTIGKPLSNTQIYILDDNLKAVPVGVTGEIYISGDGVGRGYLNNKELTNKSFIPNPFIVGTIMYKTGDIGTYNSDGTITCLGRLDHQVKIRGLRIELGEIEEKIKSMDLVENCIVIKATDDDAHEYLCAYYTTKEDSVITSTTIRDYLARYLPRYMVPTYFMKIDHLPYTPNGKIDRKRLPQPQLQKKNKNISKPQNPIEERLVAILSNLLKQKQDQISTDDDFFDLGGDSLSAINLTVQIQSEWDCNIHISDIINHPKIKEIAEKIAQNAYTEVVHEEIPKVPEREYYDVSTAQKRMYYTAQIAGKNSIVYNIPGAAILEGKIDITKLGNCLNKLIDRHESLRTHFETKDEKVVQIIDKKIDYKPEVLENQDYSKLDQIYQEFIKPFDLSKAPLFRAKIVQFSNKKTALFIDMHHIISDGASLSILTDELAKLYNDEKLPELTITYKDYAEFEKERLKSEKLKKAEEYWIDQLEDEIPILNMHTDHQRPNIQDFKGKKIYTILDKTFTKKIKETAKQLGLTPYMFLITNYYILLEKYTSQEDIIVGTSIAGRYLPQTDNLVGMFVNTLALREKVQENQTFKDFATSVKSHLLESYKYQAYPFDELINKLDIQKDRSHNPIFDTMFIYQNNGYKAINLKGTNSYQYMPDTNIAKFDLSLEVIPENDHTKLAFEYATSLFDEKTIQNFANHYINIINKVIENTNIKISDIYMLSEEEEKQILQEFDNTKVDYPREKTIVDLFEEQAKQTPNNIAVIYENEKLTYSQLNSKANSLANYMINAGIKPKEAIGIRIDKSLEMIIAILAIIKAGCYYVPINMQYPEERVQFMLKDSNAKLLLGTEKSINEFDLEIEKLNISSTNSDIYKASSVSPNLEISPEDLIYIIYTSGSTGTPKGAMICHRNVVRLLKNDSPLFDFNENDIWTMFHSVAFDFSVWEMYGALLFGGKLIIVSDNIAKDPNLFLELLEKEKVTVLNQTPTYFYNLLKCEAKTPHKNMKIRYIIFGGEALKPTEIAKWHELHPQTKLINMYGITETTVHVTYKELQPEDLELAKSNIGKPIPGLKILLLDKNLKLVPHGVPGEICVCGTGVFKGYLNRPELNKTKLIQNPYKKSEILYRSADSGVINNDNSLEYLGRIDKQVKIRGFRVELGEIEEKIRSFENIEACFVTTRKIKNTYDALCAYYIANAKINISSLKSSLQKVIPTYMVPQYFIEVSKWPYNHNGKIDVKKLPEPQAQSTKDQISLPRNEIDSDLISILRTLLNIEQISIDDSFFDIGGDSLSAINLCAHIKSAFNVQLYVRDILEHPTIRELSDIIRKSAKHQEDIHIMPVEKSEYYPVSSAQKRIYFASKVAGKASTLYNIPGGVILEGRVDINKLEDCLNKLIERHESLRTYFELKDENVVQKILEEVEFKLQIKENVQFSELKNIFKEFVQPFDLAKAPLLRAQFVRFTDGKSAIFVDMHHIISDGTSLAIFTEELCKLYNNEQLGDLKITYKDFAVYENEKLKLEKEAEKYWVEQFKEEIPVLNMPTKSVRPAIKMYQGQKVYKKISNHVARQIEEISNKLEITPYMMLLTSFYILLSKYTSQEDIVVGSPIVGRDIADTYDIIGMFANTLALRCKIDREDTFKELTAKVRDKLLTSYKYQTYPFDELVNNLGIKRDTSRNPLFDVMFIYQNNGYKEPNFNKVKAKYYVPDIDISKFDITLEAIPSEDGINFSVEYDKNLFEEDFIKTLASHYINILGEVVLNDEIKVSEISMLSEEEKRLITKDFNQTKLDYPKDKTLIELFEEQVRKTPGNTAVVFETTSLTYKQLNEKANKLAFYLREKRNIKRGDLVRNNG